MTFCSLLF